MESAMGKFEKNGINNVNGGWRMLDVFMIIL